MGLILRYMRVWFAATYRQPEYQTPLLREAVTISKTICRPGPEWSLAWIYAILSDIINNVGEEYRTM